MHNNSKNTLNRASTLYLRELSKHQISRFVFVGLLAFLTEFCIFTLLVDLAEMPYTLANYPAMGIAIVVNYFLTKKHVFTTSRYNPQITFLFFILFTLAGAALNQFLLWFFAGQVELDVKLSKIIAVGLTSVFNYLTKKHFVF